MRLPVIIAASAVLALAGCNTALQIIDPWPAGVQETDFAVPAARGGGETGGGGDTGANAASTGQTTTTTSLAN